MRWKKNGPGASCSPRPSWSKPAKKRERLTNRSGSTRSRPRRPRSASSDLNGLEEEWSRRVMRPSSLVEQARKEARALDEQIRIDKIEAAKTAQRELHQRNLTIAMATCAPIA